MLKDKDMKPSRVDIDSIKIETGKHTYFINVVATSNGKKYLKISERIPKEDGTYFYDKIIIHEEHLETICIGFLRMLKHFKIKKKFQDYMNKQASGGFKNNNQPWDAKDDLKLEKLYCKRKTVEELSTIFSRNQNSIEERIERLGLKEKYDFDIN